MGPLPLIKIVLSPLQILGGTFRVTNGKAGRSDAPMSKATMSLLSSVPSVFEIAGSTVERLTLTSTYDTTEIPKIRNTAFNPSLYDQSYVTSSAAVTQPKWQASAGCGKLDAACRATAGCGKHAILRSGDTGGVRCTCPAAKDLAFRPGTFDILVIGP